MTAQIAITLPWPLAKLSPNGRGHWTTKETARTAAKRIAYINSAMAIRGTMPNITPPLSITITVNPPSKRRFDWDGIVSRLKYYQDGIFDYLDMDDNCIKRAEVIMGDVTPGGAVNITLEEWRGQ